MKKVILALVMMSSFAQAGTVAFKTNSPLPKELQEKISAAVAQKCPGVYSITEDFTAVEEKHVDQQMYDNYYTTYLRGQIAFDGTHPVVSDITVRSVQAQISNPAIENPRIDSIISADCQ